MTAPRRGNLVADVGVREHRDGTSENRASGSFPERSHLRKLAKVPTRRPLYLRAQGGLAKRGQRASFRPA
jgi:hypothetical protein